jgi:hypothetical protein
MDNKVSFMDKLIERTNNYKFHKVFGLDLDVFILGALLFLCCGLAPGGGIVFYIFGFLFFICGLSAALNAKGFGLIFLVSHGGIGYSFMLSSFISNTNSPFSFTKLINHPSFTDGGVPTNVMIYFIVFAIILLLAIVLTVLHNLFDKMKKDKIYLRIVLSLYLISIVLAGLFRFVFPYLFK